MVEQSQYATTTKYIVKAHFDVQGVVEKPDVVGAVFGQTEGLFGPDLDLRELQKSGRIGRIEINLDYRSSYRECRQNRPLRSKDYTGKSRRCPRREKKRNSNQGERHSPQMGSR